MNALLLTLFVSLGLVTLSVLAFGFMFRQRDLEHTDRLSLLPLDDDAERPSSNVPAGKEPAR